MGGIILDAPRLGPFEPRELLHDGSGGRVWLAQSPGGATVVVKQADEPAAVQRLAREAVALRRLDHAHVGVLLDELSGPFGHALVLEHVPGRTLRDALGDGPVHPETALSWTRQLCRALAHCHARGVVHRDVKASNVLVRGDGADARLTLIDFGIADIDGDGEQSTAGGPLLGSVHTVSPEMIRGLGVDHRADLYAVGVLLYRMLAGVYPFHDANPAAIIAGHLGHEVPPLPSVLLPEGLEDALYLCLAKQPVDRPGSAGSLDEELAALERVPEYRWVPAIGLETTLVPTLRRDERAIGWVWRWFARVMGRR